MFNLSPEKILVLGIFALVVLGPNRLPQAARTLGRLLAEFRRVSGSFHEEVRGALAEPHDVLSKAVGDLGVPRLPNLGSTLRSTVSEAITPAQRPVGSAAGAGSASPEGGGQPDAVPDDPSLN